MLVEDDIGTLADIVTLSEFFGTQGPSSSPSPVPAVRRPLRRKRSFEAYMVDSTIPDTVPGADRRSVEEADGGVSSTGVTEDAEMTDVGTTSATKKRAYGRRDDDGEAKMEDPAARPVKRRRRVHFDPVVSVGRAPIGVDRTRIWKRTRLTREEHRDFAFSQKKARVLQAVAVAACNICPVGPA